MKKLFTVACGRIIIVFALCLGSAQGILASEKKSTQENINFSLASSLSIPQIILACLPEFIRPSTARVHAGVPVNVNRGPVVKIMNSIMTAVSTGQRDEVDRIINDEQQKMVDHFEKIQQSPGLFFTSFKNYIKDHGSVGLSGLWKKDKFPVGMGRFRPEKVSVGVELQDGARDVEVSAQVAVGKELWLSQLKNFRPYQTYGKAKAVVPTTNPRNLHGCSAEVGAKWDEKIMPECIKTLHPDTKLSAKFSQKDGVILRAAIRLKQLQLLGCITPKMMVELNGRKKEALVGVSLSSDGSYDNNADNDDLIAPESCSHTFKFK